LISVRNISKSFGGLSAVKGCSLDVPTGSITGLIGPNGAGKTTLFNIIAGFIRPDSGAIELDGNNVTGLPPHRLFQHGLMRTFQIPHVFNGMTVLENLMVVPDGQSGENIFTSWLKWRHVQSEDNAIADRAFEVIEFLGLGQVAQELAGALSGGQKKLLELGRTMMTDCKTVLLDEPGAGVNPTLMAELVSDIERLNSELGYTFCIIEHDMDLIAELCDPVIVMAEGSVLTQGTFDEVRSNQDVLDAYLGGGTVSATPGPGPVLTS
jgi:branched-chain amino acid transport system ATP-binding protein